MARPDRGPFVLMLRCRGHAPAALLALGLAIHPDTAGAADPQPAPQSVAPATAVPVQSAAADAGGANTGGIETVVVTAQKRRENIRAIPNNITAISGDQLKKEHVQDFTDLARAVPGLAFANSGGSGLDKIELRGISSDSDEPTVGIYLDEVPITSRNLVNTGATEPKFFDLDRVEVLRGPQGTLYGASSMGGTIRFITKQPDLDTFGGTLYSELSATKHGGINYEETGVLNLPIVEGQVGLRVGIDLDDQSGYVDHYTTTGTLAAQGVNDEKTGAVHATLKIKASDNLTITPSVFFQRLRSDDTSVYSLPPTQFLANPFVNPLALPPLSQDKEVKESGRDTLFVPSITIDDDLGWANLTAISSYFWRMFPRVQDGTYYNSVLLAETLQSTYPQDPTPIANLPAPAYITPTTSQYTEEIRLASKSATAAGVAYTWVTGLYFTDQHTHLSDQEYINDLYPTLQSVYGADPNTVLLGTTGVNGPLLGNLVYSNTDRFDQRQYAVFGEGSVNITPALKLIAGLRYSFARSSLGGVGGALFNADAPLSFGQNSHSYALTPKYAVTYDLDPSNTIYANASKGFRLGGANQPTPNFECTQDYQNLGITGTPKTYGPDSLWSYEFGTKSRFFDNHMSLGASVYYIDWSNAQQHVYLPICGFDFNTNVGNAHSYGTEVESHVKVTDDLVLSVSADFSHASVTSALPGSGAVVGSKLLDIPDWSATFSAEYAHPISDGIDGFARFDWEWIGSSHGAFETDDPNYEDPPYNVLNMSLGATVNSIELTLFAKNLLNQDKTIQRPSLLSANEGYSVRPRTVGLSVSAPF